MPAAKDKRKAPRWESEEWIVEHPDPDKVPCGSCTWREADRKLPSGTVISGATLGMCQVYGMSKPSAVLWRGAECPYYLRGERSTVKEQNRN